MVCVLMVRPFVMLMLSRVVISVDRVRPVFDLLHNKPYLNILRRCLDLVALDQVKLIPKASLSPPILHIPGRLVC